MNNKKAKIFALTALIIYITIMIYFMFFWRRGISYQYLYNLKPFKSIYEYFETYMRYVKNTPDIPHHVYVFNINIAFRALVLNIFGNIGMFIPFGILLTMLFDFKLIKPLIVFEIGLLVLEFTQYITRRGVFDIDDIILNTIGFLIGYALIKIISKLLEHRRTKQIDKI